MLAEEPLRVLRRLQEDDRLGEAEERLRKNFYHLWKPYREAKDERSPDTPRGAGGGVSREEAPQAPEEPVPWWRRMFRG